MLFTTRYMISDLAESVRHLGLDKMSYAESYRLSNFSPTLRAIPLRERQDVFKRLDGHPRAYEFLEVILKKDKDTDWSTLAASVGQVEAQVWADLLLEKIYAGLTEAEQRVLQMAAVCFTRTPLGVLVAISGEEEGVLMPLLQSLHEWSLCFWDGEGKVFEVHRLTREWLLKNMVDEGEVKKWAFVVGEYFRGQPTWGDEELAKDYYEISEAWGEFAEVSFNLENHYRLIGFYQKGFELNQAIVAKNIDEKTNADAYNRLGLILKLLGQLDRAQALYEQSLAIQQQIGDRSGEGTTLNNISQIYAAKGDYNRTLDYLEQSLAIVKQIGDRKNEGGLLNNLSQIYSTKGDYDRALHCLEQSLLIRQQIGDIVGLATTLNNMGAIYWEQKKDGENAIMVFGQAYQILKQIGSPNAKGPEAYLGEIFEAIGEARFQEIIAQLNAP